MRKSFLLTMMVVLAFGAVGFAENYTFTIYGKGQVNIKAITLECDASETFEKTIISDQDGQVFSVPIYYLCTNSALSLEMTPAYGYRFMQVVAGTMVYSTNTCVLNRNGSTDVQIYFNPPVNFVQTTIHNVDGNNSNVTGRSYTDGLGKPVQSVTKIRKRVGPIAQNFIQEKSLVSGAVYDELGRPSKSVHQ